LKNGDSEIIKIDSKKIELKCKNGHIYTQTRGNLLKGKKCIKCYLLNKTYTINEILEEFEKVHGNYYNYDLSDYKNLHSKIKIECNKNHIFSQKVSNHLQGKACPKCRESLGERVISKFLEDREIKYIRQKKFNDCKYISYLPFDFFVEEYNLLIEYDGIQHEKPVKLFGGEKEFKKTQIKDDIKNKYCLDKKINLLRISHRDDIFEKLNTIKEYIIFKS
jgi:very-short-patch-repair endonuclease